MRDTGTAAGTKLGRFRSSLCISFLRDLTHYEKRNEAKGLEKTGQGHRVFERLSMLIRDNTIQCVFSY